MGAADGPLTDLDRTPPSTDPHLWADYIELLCLVNADRVVSAYDVKDRIRERRDVGEAQVEPEDIEGASESEKDDQRTLRVDDWFRHLKFRAGTFGDAYPFEVLPDGETLIAKDSLTGVHRIYVLLLLASALRYVVPRHKVADCFESLSERALRRMMPVGAEVHRFQRGTRYTGGLFERIKRLAADLGERVTAVQRDYAPQNVGDDGLDLVGWVPIGDQLAGRLIFFAQCACTDSWVKKQFSSSAENWQNRMTFQARPRNLCFIPFSFRGTDGAWHRQSDIADTVLMDRLRLLLLLDGADGLEGCEEIVDQVLQQQEGLT